MAKHKSLNWREVKKLGDLQQTLGVSLPDMLQLVDTVLHKEPYSKQEVCDLLSVTPDELNTISLSEKTYSGGKNMAICNIMYTTFIKDELCLLKINIHIYYIKFLLT